MSRMAYDEALAERVRTIITARSDVTERKMFGGIAWMLEGNMAVGISSSAELMVRLGPDATDDALSQPHTRLFDMAGRPMKGWILVAPEGVKTKRQLDAWVARGTNFAGGLPPKG